MAPYNEAPETGARNDRPAGRGAGAGALVAGALFVGLIAVCALVISYNGVFRFAEYGGHEGSPMAHVFPVTYTLLLLMAFWVSYVLRDAHPRDRLWVDVLLIPILVLVAAVAMVLSNLGLVGSVRQGVANVIVAVAPLAALLVAFLLWITVRAHIRRRRRASAPRPQPSDDRTTVLHGRAVSPPWEEGEPDDDRVMTTRLLRFGPEDDRDFRDFRDGDTTEAFDAVPERGTSVPPPPSWSEPEPEPEAEMEPEPEPPSSDEESAAELDEIEASVPTNPLPRRSRTGANPIKRAAEGAPVVPGAAAPVDMPEPEPDRAPTDTVPELLADNGFEHDPLPGDPATDEAEAPAVPVTTDPEPEPDPLPDEEVVLLEPGSGVEPEPEPGPVDSPIPDTALWEPPSDDVDGGPLADYVPPVWTPPEDDAPSPLAHGESAVTKPEPTPVLDHDTGPEVRAAFRFGAIPPGAARPEPELEPGPEDLWPARPKPAPEAAPAPAPRPVRPVAERRPPVEKRPMILKPPRPPMRNLSGPPSRRVRSEPLPPQD